MSKRQAAIGREPQPMFTVKEQPTTPAELLSILNKVEKPRKKGIKYTPLRGGGSASYAKRSAMEANILYKEEHSQRKPSRKKEQWKPVKAQQPVKIDKVPSKKNSRSKLGEEPVGGHQPESSEPSVIYPRSVDPAVVLSPGNIVRMLEGKRLSIFRM